MKKLLEAQIDTLKRKIKDYGRKPLDYGRRLIGSAILWGVLQMTIVNVKKKRDQNKK